MIPNMDYILMKNQSWKVKEPDVNVKKQPLYKRVLKDGEYEILSS
jgi:hypothetical protein